MILLKHYDNHRTPSYNNPSGMASESGLCTKPLRRGTYNAILLVIETRDLLTCAILSVVVSTVPVRGKELLDDNPDAVESDIDRPA